MLEGIYENQNVCIYEGEQVVQNDVVFALGQLQLFFVQGRSARVGLDDINEAFAVMSAGEVARSVIVFD